MSVHRVALVPGHWHYRRPLEPRIVVKCGLGGGTNLRARFRDAVGTTPTAYRRAFNP